MDYKKTILMALDFTAASFEHDKDSDPELVEDNKKLVLEAREAYRLIETDRITLLQK